MQSPNYNIFPQPNLNAQYNQQYPSLIPQSHDLPTRINLNTSNLYDMTIDDLNVINPPEKKEYKSINMSDLKNKVNQFKENIESSIDVVWDWMTRPISIPKTNLSNSNDDDNIKYDNNMNDRLYETNDYHITRIPSTDLPQMHNDVQVWAPLTQFGQKKRSLIETSVVLPDDNDDFFITEEQTMESLVDTNEYVHHKPNTKYFRQQNSLTEDTGATALRPPVNLS